MRLLKFHLGLLAEVLPANPVLRQRLLELRVGDTAFLLDIGDVLVDLGIVDLFVVFFDFRTEQFLRDESLEAFFEGLVLT